MGQDIRPIGCDISVDGNPVLKKNTSLGPIELGVLAAVGVNQVLTYKPPDVALLSTGDEVHFNHTPIQINLDILKLKNILILII